MGNNRTDMQDINIKLARQRIEENWDNIGACRSCGYHAMFREHDVDDYVINNALKTDGIMELLCQNEDGDIEHRGIKFNLNNLEHKYTTEATQERKEIGDEV